MNQRENKAILLVDCPDEVGIIAACTNYLKKNDGNIVGLEQHVDHHSKHFFMRIEWELDSYKVKNGNILSHFEQEIGTKYGMNSNLSLLSKPPVMGLFVSKLSHCLYDILYRKQSGEWDISMPLIISNHPDLKYMADRFEIDFHHVKIDKENKKEQEQKQLDILLEYSVDFIVLARYMQILTPEFIRHYPYKIINIHHSFLPAFPGARPYHSAFDRGVKIIGATSHYVTDELDAGPIIAQEVSHSSHKDSVEDLVRKGKDLEKLVLSQAIKKHIERKILVFDNKTLIFN